MTVSILGAGAFGTALAQVLSENGPVTLWARNADMAAEMNQNRVNSARLPGVELSASIKATSELDQAASADIILLCLPAQSLREFLRIHGHRFSGKTLISCAKGIDLTSLVGTGTLVSREVPDTRVALLSGPGFAGEIARGMPTALTIACGDGAQGNALQQSLSTSRLRLYLTDDVAGVEIGGALKNVVAIACGLAIGGGQGESARAAIMTRGFAELRRLATRLGAREETLFGLSGFGDLALTCTSMQSRNFRLGISLGSGGERADTETVEGVATARAVSRLVHEMALELPITETIVAVLDGQHSVSDAIQSLMSRPLRKE